MNDKYLIRKLVDHIRESENIDLEISRWPDEENRITSDIDAIAGKYAVEHTSVDFLSNQRRNSAWFRNIFKFLEGREFDISYRLRIIIPYDAIRKGQDWNAISASLNRFVFEDSKVLPDGKSNIDNHSGVPFSFTVDKDSNRHPYISIVRSYSSESDSNADLKEQIDSKLTKLEDYASKGYLTVLLIESNDFMLINEYVLIDALKDAYEGNLPINVSQIWYGDTSFKNDIIFSRIK